MIELEPHQYVAKRNLGPDGRPIRRGRRGQFAKTPDQVAEPAVAVQRGGRERVIPFSKWFKGVNADKLSWRWWTDSGNEPAFGRKLPEPIPDLTRAKWFAPSLSREEERELVLLARAGDVAAGNKLLRRFHKMLRRAVRQKGFAALGDDRMAIACHGLAQAIARCDVDAVNGIAPYAQLYVLGALRDAMKMLRKKGFKYVPAGVWPELKGGNAIEIENAPAPAPWADFDEIE